MKKILSNFQGGQTLIELLITIGLAAILMPAFLTSFFTTRSGRAQQDQRLQAIAYVREAEEAVRIVRDNNWSNLTDGTFCPSTSGTTWALNALPTPATTCNQPGAGFTRTIVIADVCRDVSNQIAVCPANGTDPSTKAVTITVSWSSPIASQVTQTIYLTRHDNLSYLDTSVADFTAGNTSGGTFISNIYGGEVQIGGSGGSNWCQPNSAGIVKYKQTGNGQEIAISAVAPNGVSNPGHAYTTFGNNQSGNPLDSLSVTDPTSGSPVVSGGTSFTADAIKTYGLYADPTSPYVYLTSDSNQITVDVINTNDYTQHAATLKITGENGDTVYVATINGTKIGFVATTKNSSYFFHAFKTNNGAPSGTLSTTGPTITLSGQAKKILVVGNYAYVVTNSTSSKLQIIDVTHIADASNPTMSLFPYSWADGNSMSYYQTTSQGGTDLAVDSTGQYLFISTSVVGATTSTPHSGNNWDAFMIKLVSPTSPLIVDGTNTYPMSPLGIVSVAGHMIVVGSGAPEYQVYYTSPKISSCGASGNMTLSGGTKITAATAVSESDGDNFAYIITDDSTGWFQIVPGGATAGGGGGTGVGTFTFISQPIPVPSLAVAATFNSFAPVADTPGNTVLNPNTTSIKFQVAVAATCAGPFDFVGTNGDPTLYFATGSAVPLTAISSPDYANPGKCFKYKAYLTNTTPVYSPVLYEVRVNYSP